MFSPLYLKIFEKSPFLMKTPTQNFAHHTEVKKHPFGVKTPILATLVVSFSNVILMRFFFIRYVKTSFVKFVPRPLFHQWPPGGASAVNTYKNVNKSSFRAIFWEPDPESHATLVLPSNV